METAKNKRLLEKLMLVFIALTVLIQLLGVFWSLYAEIPWLDVPAHLLGGAFVGVFSIWLFFYSPYFGAKKRVYKNSTLIITAVLTLLVAATLWEWYEYILGPFYYGNYVFDTAKDIADGLLGSLASSVYFVKSRK